MRDVRRLIDPPHVTREWVHHFMSKFMDSVPNAELNLLSPGSGCPAGGDGTWAARTGSGLMLMRGGTFLKVHTRPRLAYALRCRGY